MSKVIGTAPYQVPTNADLGTMAFQDSSAVNITGGIISLTGSSSNVASTSTTTGALVVAGGVGIGGQLWVSQSSSGGIRTTNSTIFDDGNLHIHGVTGDLWFNSTAVNSAIRINNQYNGNVILTNGVGNVQILSTQSSASTSSGALQVVGGAGIGGNLYVGGTISGTLSGNAATVSTIAQTANAIYYPTFVDANNVNAAAENVYTTSSFVINPLTGNLGIGTTTPQSKLTVTGSTVPASDSTGEATGVGTIRINNGSTATSSEGGIEFKIAGDSNGYGSKIQAINSSGSQLVFANRHGSAAWTERLRITNNGGIAFSGAANYGVSGQILQSNGDAAPTWVSVGALTAGIATTSTQVQTTLQTANASYFPTFVDSNNATATGELVYTTSSFVINPSTGNVGVGTATPAVKLSVAGILGVGEAGGTGSRLQITSSVGGAEIFQNDNSDIIFKTQTATQEKMRIRDATGNVGIGTQSPIDKLQVTGGNITIDNSNYYKGKDSTGVSRNLIGINSSNNTTIGTNVHSGRLIIEGGSTATSLMTLASDNKVGIGTNDPNSILETEENTTTTTALTITNSNTGSNVTKSSRLTFRLTDTAGTRKDVAYITAVPVNQDSSTGDHLAFATRTADATPTEKLRITNNGGFSFGASGTAYGTAGQVLQSNGDAVPTWVTASGLASGQVQTVSQTASANYYPTFVDANNGSATAETVYTSSGIMFNPANGGQLAINTTPSGVAGLTVGKVFGSATSAESFPVYFTGAYTVADTGLKQVIRTNYSGQHTSGIQEDGANILALASVGGVGGVTTKLYNYWSRMDNSTNATVTNAFHYFISDGAGSGGPVNQYGLFVSSLTKGTANNYAIYTDGTTKSYFGGNVGIGTTTPGEKLAVAGAITVSGQASSNKTSAGTVDFFNTDNSTRILSWGSAGIGGKISFWTGIGGSGTVERMSIDSTGNVGIGVIAPAYKLEVNGSFAATSKSFLIDHPTKPGKKLRHGSLEGPEHGVYVRGKLNGGVIELPEYWTKLVDPDTITVQLTAIGKGQKLYVEDIRDNKVYIANDGVFAGEPHCFYLVQAERIDVDKMEIELNGS